MKYFKQIWLFPYSYHIAKASGSLPKGFLLSLAGFVSPTVPLRLSHHPHRAGGFHLFWRPVFLPHFISSFCLTVTFPGTSQQMFMVLLQNTSTFSSLPNSFCLTGALVWRVQCHEMTALTEGMSSHSSSPSPTMPYLEKNLVKAEHTSPYISAVMSQSMTIS